MSEEETEHEFGALNTLLLVVILGLAVIAAYFIKQNKFYMIPESGAAIVVGMLTGAMTTALYPNPEEIAFLTLQPDIFFFILLPPIIFEAGYSLNRSSFFTNFWSISLFAVVGTVISTLILGYAVYMMGKWGIVNIDTHSPMEAMMFGALLSSTDPVATLSILGNPALRVQPLLYSLIFGESVLNDAVAIALFKTCYSFAEKRSTTAAESHADPNQELFLLIGTFSLICLGSIVVGVTIGLICSFICKRTSLYKYPEYEIAMLFVSAYGSYSFSEAIQVSGIMSLFFTGIVLSHYNLNNLSPISRITSHYIFKSLAAMSEFLVYLYIGLGMFNGQIHSFNPLFWFCTLLVCIFARLCNIFPLSMLVNCGRSEKITWRMQIMQWFAGLRGAIAFVLAMQIPAKMHGRVYLSTTLGVVVFTTILFGSLTEPAVKYLGLQTAEVAVGPNENKSRGPVTTTSSYEEVSMEDTSSDTGMNPECTTSSSRSAPIPIPKHGAGKMNNNDSLAQGGGEYKASPDSPAGYFMSGSPSAHGLLTQSQDSEDSITGVPSSKVATSSRRPLISDFLRRFDEEYMMVMFSTPSHITDDSSEPDTSPARISGPDLEGGVELVSSPVHRNDTARNHE